MDVVESDDPKQVEKAAMLIRPLRTLDDGRGDHHGRRGLQSLPAESEVEKAVYAALKSGKLHGTETLKARAKLEIAGLETDAFVEGDITLA